MGVNSDANGFSSHYNGKNGFENIETDQSNGVTANRANGTINGTSNGISNGDSTSFSQQTYAQGQVPIAICGMGMRLPGGIHNDQDLYNFLIEKKDARSTIGEDRFNVDAYYSPHGKDGTINTKHGYFVNDVDLSKFDLSMFALTPAEAEQMDPNQRLVLEVVREAFESAGEVGWRGKNIGTYVGMFSEDWQDLEHKDIQEYNPYRVLGGLDFALPNRVSYEYDLKGPSMVIKSACSAAGLALHQAAEAIRQGRISSAVVCGSNLIMAPGMTISMSMQMALSPEGSSKSFDASADGYARGEAVNALYIKRLDEAVRDGNPIRAILRGSAANADGKTNGMSVPNPDAHEAVIRQAYISAGLDLSETALVETHGTGTKLGDPLEARAIGNCFREKGVFLGAIKPNLGHSEGAAAITSIIKSILSLERRTIIPNIKFNTPNPAIPWEADKLAVPVEPNPWPENKAERISVNSYGIGGSNAHFIIDSAASFGLDTPHSTSRLHIEQQRPQKNLLLFSANHTQSLKRVSENIEAYTKLHPDRLEDLAYTLAKRREHLKLRSYCVFKNDGTPLEVSAQIKFQSPSQAAFVFTGQGAQWAHMGKELIIQYPSVLENIRAMDRVLQGLKQAPLWSIEDILLNSDDPKLLGKAEFSQPLCTALQIALVDLFATWGVTPSAVIGHSSGEIAAAYAAGVLTSAEAIITAYYRGFVCKIPQRSGGMAAVGMGKDDVTKYLVPGVRVACENSKSSVTLSGDMGTLEEIMSSIRKEMPDTLVRKLQVEMAYHSHHMSFVGDLYRELIAKHISPRSPKIPFHSSVKSKVLDKASDFAPQYWQDNLENPVLFRAAAKSLVASNERSVHLEIGPHAALSGPLRQIYKETPSATINYVSALIRKKDGVDSFLEAVGQLWALGVPISYPYDPKTANVLSDLPTYPWNHDKSYWAETRVMKNWRFRKHLPHDLIGLRTIEGSEISPTWRNILRLADVPWLSDHRVGKDIIFPGAGYVAMAGEAIFQINNIRDYTVRDVELSKAMVVYNDKPLELFTNLQPQRLTTTINSEWYEFQIISYDGATWNKHCSGLVRSGRASEFPTKKPKTDSLDRRVSSPRWYTTMSRVGLNYGPRFSGLDNIAASVAGTVAGAEILDEQEAEESLYMIHPATLDLVFQTFTIASNQGIHRNLKTLGLPTFIEELYVGEATKKTIQIMSGVTGRPGADLGDSYGIAEGEMVFYVKGLQRAPINIEAPPVPNSLQLQWKPHFDFLKAGDLMELRRDIKDQLECLERLFVMCAIETKHAIVGVKNAQPHFEKFRVWLDQQFERFQQPGYPLVRDSVELVRMSSAERQELIPKALELCQASGCSATAVATYRVFTEAANIFSGQTDYLDLLLQDGILTGIYAWYNEIWEFKDYMQLLGHLKPQLRILEIGAGTGGLTYKLLEHLKSDYGERLYLKYAYTDISSGFFAQAKERFKDYDGIEYKELDISKNPVEQGFNAGEYDLILASNVLHATPSLHETLSNVRTLLKPDGQLFMQELCPVAKVPGFLMGAFSGWWEGEQDGRADSPFIEPEEWDKRLRLAGFAGCDSVNLDYEAPYTYSANIVAKPAVEPQEVQKITLLRGPKANPLIAEVEDVLRERGIEFEQCEWGQPLPTDQDIISFLDIGEKPLLQDIDEGDLAKLLEVVESLEQSTLLWLSPAAQIHPIDPHAAQILGMVRTIRQELALSFATLELDTATGAASTVVDVLATIQKTKDDMTAELDSDMEYVWSNGKLNVGRFHWVKLDKQLSETTKETETKALTIGTPGLLQTLHWTSQTLGVPAPDEVHIQMTAVGLNFKDVMIGMGIINGDNEKNPASSFGLEGTGYITKVGSQVTNVAVGDRVMSIGCETVGMATSIQRPASLCIKIPDQLTDEEAATMPIVYVTVLLFLVEKWRLEKGQSILIHSAAGGVGICAINVAKWIGAEIYATVGSEEKANFLTSEFGIPRNHIFSSRDNSFLKDVMDATKGVGVDVVLNSLAGELLATSWKCVAPCGAMIEIGKRDMVGRGQLPLAPFEDNRTFLGGDIARMMVSRKSTIARLLKLTLEQYIAGNFKPITPITTFDAGNMEEAFRFMQKGSHIGKIVIKFPKEDTLPLTQTVPAPQFRGDVSYVLIGGLGGLGKAVANWMASYGARNLIFLSRSAGKTEEDQAFAKELKLMGCSSQFFPCDIADYEAVKSAVSQATLPIAGAMQMAMVLADISFLDMTLDNWNRATRPKIQGTWNLHHLLPKEMDFFVLFSSFNGTFGYYGQSNYAAGNTFLDAFAQYRQSLGLTCSVVDIGPVDEIGFLSRTEAARKNFLVVSNLVSEKDFLDYLQLTIARSSTEYAPPKEWSELSGFQARNQIVHTMVPNLPIMDPRNAAIWKRDPRMAIYRNIETVSAAEKTEAGDQLKQFLSSMMSDPSKLDQKESVDTIAKELGRCVSNFLSHGDGDIELTSTLSSLGVDSLVAIEIRNWWKQNLGIDISVLELLSGGSIEQLGDFAAKRLKVKYAGK